MSHLRISGIVVWLSVVGAGCSRVDPNHTIVAAGDVAELAAWQRNTAADFPTALKSDLAAALQEIRYDITAQQQASGHDAIEAVLCSRVNGRTVDEVLQAGYGLKLHRLEAERVEMQRVVDTNANMITKPGDERAATTLAQIRSQQQKRLGAIDAEIQALKKQIAAQGGVVAPGGARPPAPKMSREEALGMIATMMQEQRNPALLTFGGWPVKIDRTGQQLDEATQRDYTGRKSLAEADGHIIVPIKIKEHWLLFEGPNQAPDLPIAVAASLTESDRRKFKDDWVNLQAEVWARKTGASFEIPKPAPAPLPSLIAPPPSTRGPGQN